ncbi:MAG: asparagine--tRNA ligase [Thermoplasmata archaeon]|nr:asparagine--tRNA ligase [Thermoplasmata archaeon]
MVYHIDEILRDEYIDKKVTIRGWIYRKRRVGKLIFVVVRDSTNIVQCVVEKNNVNPDNFKLLDKVGVETSIIVEGYLRKDERAPTGYEIQADRIEIVGPSYNFPITKDKSDEFLLDNRHLWVRSREMTAILKIRDTVFGALHEFFREKGYYETHGPMFVTGAVEGGSTLFEVPYFGKKAYLTQSSQFYLETLIYSLEKVYTVAPSFRAEKSRTRRHLTEYWHAEAEAAWYHNEDMMRDEEEMVVYLIQRVLEERKRELQFLKRDLEILEGIEKPFKRMRYEELIRFAQDHSVNIQYGDDLGADEETMITQNFDAPVFITHYPIEIKPFYHRPDPENPKVVLCHDLLAPEGYGEIIGGGERIYKLEVLLQRMEDEGLNPEDYYWYVDLRKYGSVPHTGFGLGMERFIWWIAGLSHIKYAIPYPRTIRRTKP